MTDFKHLVLVGMPGSGKSTVGEALAGVLDLPLYDADVMLETERGMSISEMFALPGGEPEFRRAESEMLAKICGLAGGVVSLGGGAVLAADNKPLIQEGNFVVYLAASVATLMQNLGDAHDRPLIEAAADKEAQVKKMLGERDPVYRGCADEVVEVDGRSAEEIMQDIGGRLPGRS